jgi:hypothetical protein
MRPFVPSPEDGNAASEVLVATTAEKNPIVAWLIRTLLAYWSFSPPVVESTGFASVVASDSVISLAMWHLLESNQGKVRLFVIIPIAVDFGTVCNRRIKCHALTIKQ